MNMEDDSHWEAGHLVPVIMDDEDALRADQIRNGYREAGIQYISELKRILMFIIESDNPKHSALAIACAFGFSGITDGMTQKQIGDKFGIGKAAVSRCVKLIQSRFGNSKHGVSPMPGQKSKIACKTYSTKRKEQLK